MGYRKIQLKNKGKIIKIALLCLILGAIVILELKSCRVPCVCPVSLIPEQVVSELNGRENIRWAQVKIGPIKFETDAEIDRKIVYGITRGSWYLDISDHEFDVPYETGKKTKCDWMRNQGVQLKSCKAGYIKCSNPAAEKYTAKALPATVNTRP